MLIPLSAILGVAVVALTMVLTPGPNMIYLASRSISQGRRAGHISLAGVATGFLIYLIATSLGLGAVFSAVPILFVIVKLVGAAYLAYLAWKTLKPGGKSAFDTVELDAHRPRKLYSMGLLTSLLNPKIALMYTALIPQFVQPSHGHIWEQSLLLGMIQIIVSIIINGLIVLSASGIAGFFKARPKVLRAQKTISGFILGGFAIKMALDKQTA